MPDHPPVLLLPPSKGKAEGGDGPGVASVLTDDHPLSGPRRRVLDAVADDVPGLDDATLRRVAGVAAKDVDEARRLLGEVASSPTLPAHRRYTGVVHGNAGLADLDPAATEVTLRIVSPLLGLVAPAEPVPAYRLELGAVLPSLGGLGPFWRDALRDHLVQLCAERRVWDLLPGEHRRIWSDEVRTGLDLVDVRFLRPDGRAANAARTKVAKGRIAAAVLGDPTLRPRDLAAAVTLDPGWSLEADADGVIATYAS